MRRLGCLKCESGIRAGARQALRHPATVIPGRAASRFSKALRIGQREAGGATADAALAAVVCTRGSLYSFAVQQIVRSNGRRLPFSADRYSAAP